MAKARDWKALAAEALKQGYLKNNPWERMLRRHLLRLFPELVEELQQERSLEAYLQAQTYDAMCYAERLEDQGTPPEVARELALERLLPRPADEEDRPEGWELAGAEQDMEGGALQALLALPAQPSLPRQLPLRKPR